MVITEAEQLQFDAEFIDFDFGEPTTDEDWLEQEAEMERLDAQEASDEVTEFFHNFRRVRRREEPIKEDGCSIWVSFCTYISY